MNALDTVASMVPDGMKARPLFPPPPVPAAMDGRVSPSYPICRSSGGVGGILWSAFTSARGEIRSPWARRRSPVQKKCRANTPDPSLSAVFRLPPQVQGLLDAAALLDINPAGNGWAWSNELIPLQTNTASLIAFDNPQFPSSCTAQYSGSEAWKCIWGSYRLPMVQTPYFMTASQFDSFETQYDCDNYAPSTPQQLAFVDSFQTETLQLLQEAR